MDVYFMPSDVARIVLGYLKESDYVKTYSCFLKECSYLKEIYTLEKAGRSLKHVSQFNLVKILEEWGQFKYSNENSVVVGKNLTQSSDEAVDDTLVCDNDVTNSGRKTKVKPRVINKKSPQSVKVRRSPCTPNSSKVRLKSPRNTNTVTYERNCDEKTVCNETPNRNNTGNRSPGKCSGFTPTKSTKPLQSTTVIEHFVASLHKPGNDDGVEKIDNNCSPVKGKVVDETCSKNSENEHGIKNRSFNDNLADKENNSNNIQQRHRKTVETTKEQVGIEKLDNNSAIKIKVISETCITPVVEPPSESVDSNDDKCLAWMSKNENEIMNKESKGSGHILVHKENNYMDDLGRSCTEKLVQHENLHTPIEKRQECTNELTETTDTGKLNSPPAVATITTSTQKQVPHHITPKKMSRSESRDKSLVTPVKILHTLEHHTSRSPRRKKPKTPRKRTSEVSPVSVVSTKSVDPSSVNPIFEKILSDHRLHEKLAETCNLVHSQIKLANSGRENKSETGQHEQVSPVTAHISYEQETVTASRSLEEILGIDHNFHTEMLSDNIDMSDPAYESLFKLFGTDRETFNEYLRKEKEKELALMEAEVEELERSNHEILCANFGVSHADAGYETQDLAYSSPHHLPVHQDLFAHRAAGSPRTLSTSTPCANGVPVNFTPLLGETSPLNPGQNVFCRLKQPGVDTNTSPGSTATQPFSPAYSHHSEMNNPPTPQNQQHLSTNIHDNSPGGPVTPKSQMEDLYSNPSTPMQLHTGQIMHSTPTGPRSVQSQREIDHFHHSSPVHSQHLPLKNIHSQMPCSPLVKADIHPNSPLLTHTNIHQSSNNNGLYFSSQITSSVATRNEQDFANIGCEQQPGHFSEKTSGYLNLLNYETCSSSTREACTTIENTIGCISLPQPLNTETKLCNKKKTASRSRRKKDPPKRKSISATHATVKGLLEKPLTYLNSFPLSMKVADLQHVYRTPEKRNSMPGENLTFPSPGGKTLINVPLINCEDQIDLSVLGMDDNIDGADSQTVNVYNQSLDTSTQYCIAPENQETHSLVSAITAGNTAEIVQQIKQRQNDETKQKTSRRSNTERKNRTKKKKEEAVQSEKHDHSSPTRHSSHETDIQKEAHFDLNQDLYTATPFTSLNKAATVRALNFGPNVDDPDIAHYRKIYPKLQTPADVSPSVIILNTNQVINPGHNVIVNRTPVTLVQNTTNDSSLQNGANVRVKEEHLEKRITVGNEKTEDSESEKTVSKRVTRSGSLRNGQDNETVENADKIETKEHYKTCTRESPGKVILSPGQNKSISTPRKAKRIGGQSRKLYKDSETVESDGVVSHEISECRNSQAESLKLCNNSKDETKETVKNENKYKKNDKSQKGNKTKTTKRKEKLKVKIPMASHRSTNGKGGDIRCDKSVAFKYKKKIEIKSDVDSSDEDIPLSKMKKQRNKGKKKEYKSVEITIESETTDEEKSSQNVETVPNKRQDWSDDDDDNEDDCKTSKEVLFEKIGLTPTKSLVKHDFKSPTRANALDVLAGWQNSQLSERHQGISSNTRSKFNRMNDGSKASTTPRRPHAKKLFGAKSKEKNEIETVKGKKTAKRVEDIIDRLKQNNPDRHLSCASGKMKCLRNHGSFDETEGQHDTDKRTSVKNNLKVKKSVTADGDEKDEIRKTFEFENKMPQGVLKAEEQKASAKDNDNEVVGIIPNKNDSDFSASENNSDQQAISKNKNVSVLDANSKVMTKLNSDVASACIEYNPQNKTVEAESLPFAHCKNAEIENAVYGKEDVINISNITLNENFEGYNVPRGDAGIEIDNNLKDGTTDSEVNKSDTTNTYLVLADVHASQNSQDSCEMFKKVKESVQQTSSKSQTLQSETCKAKFDSETQMQIEPKSFNSPAEVETVDSEPVDSKSRRKKKKRKHKQCHRDKHDACSEVQTVGDQLVSIGQTEQLQHHHKRKKKKSKKRHREGSEHEQESKRRRKEKTNVSLESLAALNVDEALSHIYGKTSS